MTNTDTLPDVAFLRHYMDMLEFKTLDGYDWERGSRFFNIKYETFASMARGDSPILKRERQKIAKRAEVAAGMRVKAKDDIMSAERRLNARAGRYLRKLREKLSATMPDGKINNQAHIASLMDISIGAIQAWEYGRSRIPAPRLEQYLRMIGASTEEATKAWVMIGELPPAIKEAISYQDPQAVKMLMEMLEYCELWTMKTDEEKTAVAEQFIKAEIKPTFATAKEHIAHLVEQGMPLDKARRILAEERKPRGAEARAAERGELDAGDEI